MDDEGFVDLDAELLRGFEHGGRAGVGVGAEGLALDEGDLAVAELVQMAEGEVRGALVVEDDVGDAGQLGVAGDEDRGQGKRRVEMRVDGEDAVDAAGAEHRPRANDLGRLFARWRKADLCVQSHGPED